MTSLRASSPDASMPMKATNATSSTPTQPTAHRRGPHLAALLATGFTLPLLYVGGSVTSYGVGMAVPDWPTTFGVNMFLYNFWNDSFGVRLEHAHRLHGAAVGLATLVLAAWLLAFDRRRWVKVLGVIALAAVILQGIMGGFRVNQISTTLAAIHGGFGQFFFGLMVALVVVTGRVWREATPPRHDPGRLRGMALATVALVYGQIALGAWFRHFRGVNALVLHLVLAVAVLGVSHAVCARVRRCRVVAAELVPSAVALATLATLQSVLGVLALYLMWPLGGNPRTPTLWDAMTRTAHQTNGALLLAASIVLALRAFRHLRSVPQSRSDLSSIDRETPVSPLEVVA